jgi:uncharacterized membrane protein YdjX (TVP38/TMEM64 family)
VTRTDVTMNLTRLGAIAAAILGLWAVVTAARSVLDERYAQHTDIQRIETKIDRLGDIVCDGKPQVRACQ